MSCELIDLAMEDIHDSGDALVREHLNDLLYDVVPVRVLDDVHKLLLQFFHNFSLLFDKHML